MFGQDQAWYMYPVILITCWPPCTQRDRDCSRNTHFVHWLLVTKACDCRIFPRQQQALHTGVETVQAAVHVHLRVLYNICVVDTFQMQQHCWLTS